MSMKSSEVVNGAEKGCANDRPSSCEFSIINMGLSWNLFMHDDLFLFHA
jgi:hypothetical protein